MFKADNIGSLCMASAGSEDYKTAVENLDIRAAEEVFCVPCPDHRCSQEFLELAEILMEENGLVMLTSAEEADSLYSFLLTSIANINWTFLTWSCLLSVNSRS